MPMKSFELRVPDELYDALEEEARENYDGNKSEVVREGIRRLTENNKD